MTDTEELSMLLSDARRLIKMAHRVPDMWTEDMEHTFEAIDSLGIQHYGRAGGDTPTRIINRQVQAMVDLMFVYAEQAYEAKDDELTFFDDEQRELFHEHLDKAHDAAMTALRQVEDD